MRRLISLVGAALLVAAATAVPATFNAASAASCLVTDYIGSTTLGTITKSATVTHATPYGIPANGSVNTTKTAEHRLTLTGTFTMTSGGSISTGIIEKIVGKVSASVGYSVAAQGEHTSTSSASVQINVKNPYSTKDVTFIAYEGDIKYTGTWKTSYCQGRGDGTTQGTIQYHSGTYGTWGAHGEGGAACWATGGSSLQVKARSKYC